jgi:seryl-tRNA synthetase
VRCTHGATIGQLDAESLFYLQSRGIGKREARNMLIFAFAQEVKDIRTRLEKMLAELKMLDKDPETADTLFAKKWETYQVAEATMASKEKLLKERQKMVLLAKEKLEKMIAERDRMKTEVAKLETELEALRLAQTKSPVQVDDIRLDEVKIPNSDEPTKVEVKVKGGAQARKEFRARFGDKHLGEK